jgi:hypothetical protein
LIRRAFDRRDIPPAGPLNVVGDGEVCAFFVHRVLLLLALAARRSRGLAA